MNSDVVVMWCIPAPVKTENIFTDSNATVEFQILMSVTTINFIN